MSPSHELGDLTGPSLLPNHRLRCSLPTICGYTQLQLLLLFEKSFTFDLVRQPRTNAHIAQRHTEAILWRRTGREFSGHGCRKECTISMKAYLPLAYTIVCSRPPVPLDWNDGYARRRNRYGTALWTDTAIPATHPEHGKETARIIIVTSAKVCAADITSSNAYIASERSERKSGTWLGEREAGWFVSSL